MRFLVFGAGALGSLVAARLATCHEVALVSRPQHVAAIRAHGLRISGCTDLRTTDVVAVSDVVELGIAPTGSPSDAATKERTSGFGMPEVVLLTVKSYDTAGAVAALESLWNRSVFVSLQNGLGNEEAIAARAEKVLGAVINQGVTFVEPGHVYHAGAGDTLLGGFAGAGAAEASEVATALVEAGLPAKAVDDIRRHIWGKAVLNAAVNPLTALLRLRTGQLLENDPVNAALSLVVHESVAIAAACGVALEADEILATIEAVARATSGNKSSMLQDLEKGGRTEIDAINGVLVARARERGVACPYNELLVELIRSAEAAGGK